MDGTAYDQKKKKKKLKTLGNFVCYSVEKLTNK